MNIFDLQATISLNGDAFMQGVAQAQGAFQELGNSVSKNSESLKKGFAILGGAATAAGGAIVKSTIDAAYHADDLNTLSKQTGIATDTLQKFQYASDVIDVSTETLTGSLTKLTRNMYSAREGTGNAGEAFNALGISIVDANGELRNNEEVFNDTIAALAKVENSTERDAIAMNIFGRSAQELNPLILGGADTLAELGEQAEKAGLILSQDALDGLNSLSDALDVAKANLSQLGNLFGTVFAEDIAKAITSVTGVVSGMIAGFQDNGLKGAIEALGSDLSDALGPKFEGIVEKIKPLASEISKNLGSALSTAGQSVKGFLESFKSAPSSDVISGIADGAASLFGAFQQFQHDKLSAAASLIQGFFDAFKDSSIIESLSSAAGGVGEFLGAFSEKALEILQLAGGAVKGFIAGFMDSPAIDAIKSAAENVATFIGVFSEAIGGIILEVAGAVQSFLSSFDSERLGQVVGEIAAGVTGLFGTIVSVGSNIIQKAAEAIKGFIAAFNESGVAGKIADIAMSIGEFFAPFSETLGSIIGFVGEQIGVLITQIGQFASQAVKEIPAVLDVFQSALSAVGEMFSAIWDALQPLMQFLSVEFSQAMEKVGSQLLSVWETCKNAAVTFFEVVRDLASAVTAALSGDFETAASLVQSAFSSLGSFLEGLVGQIAGWFSGLASQMVSIGASIVDGLKQGIAGAWNSLTSWVSDKASGLVDSVKGLFGINSPSRVFAGIGKNLVLGMEKGWGGEFGDLESQVGRDLSALTGTARLAFEDSALGRSSAAGISSMLAAANGSGRSAEPIEINLMLDGDVAASALYDPLRRTAFQKGQNNNREAAYA